MRFAAISPPHHLTTPFWVGNMRKPHPVLLVTLTAPHREHTQELAHSITEEQGKTLADAAGDVFRGLEVTTTTTTADG